VLQTSWSASAGLPHLFPLTGLRPSGLPGETRLEPTRDFESARKETAVCDLFKAALLKSSKTIFWSGSSPRG
jgi:hypothetical protein